MRVAKNHAYSWKNAVSSSLSSASLFAYDETLHCRNLTKCKAKLIG